MTWGLLSWETQTLRQERVVKVQSESGPLVPSTTLGFFPCKGQYMATFTTIETCPFPKLTLVLLWFTCIGSGEVEGRSLGYVLFYCQRWWSMWPTMSMRSCFRSGSSLETSSSLTALSKPLKKVLHKARLFQPQDLQPALDLSVGNDEDGVW